MAGSASADPARLLAELRLDDAARLSAVLRAVPDLWFVVDRDDQFLLCSDENHPSLIEPFAQQLGKPFAAALDAPYDRLALEAVQRARASGEAQRLEYEAMTPDGQRRVFEARVAPMGDGQVLYLTRDLSELRRLEREREHDAERLRISEELYRSVARTISDGLVVAGPDGSVVACNPSAAETLGAEPASLIGHRLGALGYRMHDAQDHLLPREQHPVRRVLLGGAAVRELPLVLHRPDGTVRRVLLTARALRTTTEATAPSCLVSFRDVTEQHAAARALEQAGQALLDKQAAELASRAKSQFLSRMSHEMRTPLNAVIGFSQLLRLHPAGDPAKVREYADHILRASEHLLGLVNEVLDLQRVEEGRAALEPRAIELAPFLDATLELLRPAAQAQGVALSSQVPPGRAVLADERCLRQVLMNMVSNAVKYNRAGGWVVVTLLDAAPGRCTIAIEDTGSGLSDEQLARLFQPFERLGHESSGIEGSGLGLVITRSLIEQMGGTVTLSSVPGAGTLARIDLPAASVPAAALQPAPPPAPLPAPAEAAPQLRLLYVEDNRINALLFEEAMRLLGGIELQVAESGADAIGLLQTWTPQVLVLDANLPDMNGHELLQRLRQRPELAGAPAFMCSADAMPEDLERARASGFQGYWTKPIEIGKVGAAIAALRG